jgi:hypothetical protein
MSNDDYFFRPLAIIFPGQALQQKVSMNQKSLCISKPLWLRTVLSPLRPIMVFASGLALSKIEVELFDADIGLVDQPITKVETASPPFWVR